MSLKAQRVFLTLHVRNILSLVGRIINIELHGAGLDFSTL